MHEEPGLTGASPLNSGDVVAGRYQIVNELGRGGYAIVYRAKDLFEKRIIALKTIRPFAPRPGEVVARFKREAELAARLMHPNTVRVYDYGFETDLYLAMELLDGYPLSDVLDGINGIKPVRAIAIARGVLRSLTEAHQYGIVHRDLKPENVFLVQQSDGTEIVKVLDFGIAKLTGMSKEAMSQPALTMQGRAMGTPTYMSPEQAKGASLTIASDIYAVAILIYEMLCGIPPFTGDNAMDIMLKHVNDSPPRLKVPALMNSPIEMAIFKGLQKKPSRRFRDAHEFLAALGGTAVTVQGQRSPAERLPASSTPKPKSLGGIPRPRFFGSIFRREK